MRPDPMAFRQRGLTLVELLVAISVLAFVAVLGWRGLDGIVRARVALNEDLAQTRGMQLAFAQLQSDTARVASPATLPGRLPIDVDANRLSLVRTVSADDQPTRLQVVTYRLRNGELSRSESVPTRDLAELDSQWEAARNDANAVPGLVLESGVNDMSMRVWPADNSGWRNAAAMAAAGAPTPVPFVPGTPGGANPANPASAVPSYTGLEVTLQMQQRQATLLKIFLLGAV